MLDTMNELKNEEARSKLHKSKEEMAIYILDVTRKLIGAGRKLLQSFLGTFST